jgi:site-specific recombinase XerD
MFKYFKKKGWIEFNPTQNIDLPELPKRNPKYIKTVEKQQELINAVDGVNKERDKAIIVTFLNTGLRESELAALDLDSIENNILTVFHGKGDKERNVPLNQACVDAINKYLEVRPKTEDKALFLCKIDDYRGTRINRMKPITIYCMIKKNCKKIGQGELSPHKLRHTAATNWLEKGASIVDIKNLLGHEDISTTQIYTHANPKNLQDIVNKSNIG